MDWPTAAVVIVALGAAVAVIAIYTTATATAAKDKRAIDHEEFKAKLEPNHEEQLAQIAARRDAEIVKYTGKPAPVVQQIDHQ